MWMDESGVKPTSSHARAQIAAQLPQTCSCSSACYQVPRRWLRSTAPPPVLREGARPFRHPQFDSAKSGAEDSLGGVSFRRDKPGHPLFCGFQGEPNLRAVIRCCCRFYGSFYCCLCWRPHPSHARAAADTT